MFKNIPTVCTWFNVNNIGFRLHVPRTFLENIDRVLFHILVHLTFSCYLIDSINMIINLMREKFLNNFNSTDLCKYEIWPYWAMFVRFQFIRIWFFFLYLVNFSFWSCFFARFGRLFRMLFTMFFWMLFWMLLRVLLLMVLVRLFLRMLLWMFFRILFGWGFFWY